MTKIVGILNITPDSFYDGGKYLEQKDILKKTEDLIEEGADIIDIGAESTRPGATPINKDQEIARIKDSLCKIVKIAHKAKVATAIDSYKYEVIKFALDNGIDMVNDQKGLETDKKVELVRSFGVPVVVMHSLTVPTDRNINLDTKVDVISQLKIWIEKKVNYLVDRGIKKESIIFDPGIGFGKTAKQNYEIIKRCQELKTPEIKIYIGHSNKGFLKILGNQEAFTLASSVILMGKGVDFLRVHDVGSHKALQLNFF